MKLYFRRATAALLVMALFGVFFCLPVNAVKIPVPSEDYFALMKLINYTEQKCIDRPVPWSKETRTFFLKKYQYAKDTLDNPVSTDEDYNNALAELQAGVDQLVFDFNYASPFEVLNSTLQTAQEIYTSLHIDYTDVSWQAFLEEREYAYRIYYDSSSSNENYLYAAECLQYAIYQLEPFSDKSVIRYIVDKAEFLGLYENRINYTNSTYKKFKIENDIAITWIHSDHNSQEQIDAAATSLWQAVEGLVLLGDVNGDETVSVADVLEVQKSLACMITLNETQTEASDVDASGTVDVADAVSMQKYLAGMLGHFPAGEQNK